MTPPTLLKIILTSNLRLSSIPAEFRAKLMDTLTFPNPKWLENKRRGRWNRGTPKPKAKGVAHERATRYRIPSSYLFLILFASQMGWCFFAQDRETLPSKIPFRVPGLAKVLR
jgi:hypothetical protein